ncbi:diguanylate cyclase [Pseudomonas sp. AFG_SD02_1510_Pfu_092]|nr:diguanylate cyclase [Pseudomonas sp. AFG_SD02_1510_Pfu_092]
MGAAVAANTGAAGAIHRVACFAGLPAPTGIAHGLSAARSR